MIRSVLNRLNSIPADKVAHFAVGSALFALLLPFIGAPHSLAVTIFIGAAKEVYDAAHKETNTPDVWDALATAAGGALGFFCTFF